MGCDLADFELKVTAGAVVVDWEDPQVGQTPTRLNATTGNPHKNYQALLMGGVVVKAIVGGVEGEIDANLGGRLFRCWFAEFPNGPVTTVSQVVGQSSVASFVPRVPGNYLLVFARELGGSVAVPIEVVRPEDAA